MSKELEALKQVKNFLGYNYCSVDLPNELRTIEQALQRLESIDNAKPSEALKWLNGLRNYVSSMPNSERNVKYCDTIKQALIKAQEQEKVLKIIKKKNVDSYILKTCLNLEHYNSEIRRKNQNNTYSYEIWYELTQEEFDLLKRYLGNE